MCPSNTVDGPMAEILHQLIGSLSHDLQGLYIPGDSVAVCFAFWNSKHYVSFKKMGGQAPFPKYR